MRIAIHTQHFAGVGHHVRATRLARALRQAPGGGNEVLVFDGGLPFGAAGAAPLDDAARVQLPPVAWGSAGLEAHAGDRALRDVLEDRRELVVDGLRRFQPDVFLIDSFPFSRWALRDELLAGIRQVRASREPVRVVCSLRDVPRASQQDTVDLSCQPDGDRRRTWPIRPGDDGCGEVPRVLSAWFDAILVHGDPRVTRLEEHFPWSRDLRIPVHYTGYVQQEAAADDSFPLRPPGGPRVVVSVGGGVNGLELIELVTAAWSHLKRQPCWAGARMDVFAGALMCDGDVAAAAAACHRHGALFHQFSRNFPGWLRAADLSISRGGYNTLVALLAAGVRGIVLPGLDVSDQAFRARRLAELGVVTTGTEAELDAGCLAAMIGAALDRPPPTHDLDLAGAERTVEILQALVGDSARTRRSCRPAAGLLSQLVAD